ncbi:MAG: hypothetical protein RID09_06025 [Coleofasciculus sp. G1-WW12-02]|uniref:hypothetical protein n=1 Tax=Coleofasciculus sp. G1-WW12-02 TaxID=3068483 RepID=UPI0032F8ED6A
MVTRRETLKNAIDRLSEEQLEVVAAFINYQLGRVSLSTPIWERFTPTERVRYFREWVSQLPKNSPSLSMEAISRDSIYEE